ncbi:MAG: hypothetical protein UW71_C0033G0011 [Parcubacteria group bacterium GW2011_GWB1_44_7]|nr:MAG: hypothetical protein UW71_C0033G0011 [Parcubacteria group bacterium GW2011_GWB1_44_7]
MKVLQVWYYGDNMKNSLVILGLALIVAFPVSAGTPLTGKVIALDAGHGGGETGAVGVCNGAEVIEADVNLAVRKELKVLIAVGEGTAHEVAQLSSRQDRVADAEAAGSDVLISIHHNGSTNTSADYAQSFVTQKNDKIFAGYIHPKIVNALELPDKGIKNDGYGMTVYGSLPGVLTESYFVTNTDAACDFLNYQNGATNTRVQKEAQAMYDGLVAYFSANTGGGRGRNK